MAKERPMGDPLATPSQQPLREHQVEPILAASVEETDDLRLSPTECPSREQFEQKFAHLPLSEPTPPPAPDRFRFSVKDLMILMVGVSVGLAGGTWVRPDIFAGIMGLVILVGLMLIHLYPMESRGAWLAWWTTILAYVLSVLVAFFRHVP